MQLIPTKWNESDRALVVPEHAISFSILERVSL
jgi:hypothetical protein